MKSRQRLHALETHASFTTAHKIIRRLTDAGSLTVFAGGCVRDALLGRSPKDLDIATAAMPDAVEAAFPHTLAVGKDFGTIVVIEDGQNFEVTTFRREGPYLDGRHPSHVSFTEIEEDASRRDFTVNALFYDPFAHEVLDFVGGQVDLNAQILRTVGDPRARFHEDRLRLLRAVRFVSQLGFSLDRATHDAVRDLAPELKSVSAERILNEVKRLLMGADLASAVRVMQTTQLAQSFFPEAANLDPDQLAAFGPFQSWENAFAAILWLTQVTDQAEARLRAWKASRESLKRVQDQLNALKILRDPTLHTKADRIRALASVYYRDIVTLATGAMAPGADLAKYLSEFQSVVTAEGSLPKPLLNGQDLMQEGIKPGAQMGGILKRAYDWQLEDEIHTKAEALARIKAEALARIKNSKP